jgi:uncharacterized protein YecE (DUF72 family)
MIDRIRAGMGGWTFPPWRGVFYPSKLRQADELAWASRKVSTIEINGTYHSLQKRESFAKWASQTPDDFVFAVKGSRFCTNRRVLASAGEAIDRFIGQGIAAMGQKLGPILWQRMANKRFELEDLAAFLRLLPEKVEGLPLRHCVEPRHASFADPDFVDICRERRVAICLSDSGGWPLIADVTADFAYARLMRGRDDVETCYSGPELDAWAQRFALYASGIQPPDLPSVTSRAPVRASHDVFAFFISGGKVRAPAGAVALLDRLKTCA